MIPPLNRRRSITSLSSKEVAKPRERKGTVLTDRLCETPVTKRKKFYDRRTPGLYVSVTSAGVATFSCNFLL